MVEQVQSHHRGQAQAQQPHPGGVLGPERLGPRPHLVAAEADETPGKKVDVDTHQEEDKFNGQAERGSSHGGKDKAAYRAAKS